MTDDSNPVVGGYSDLASAYDSTGNQQSCWGISTHKVLGAITLPHGCRAVADIGCGTGQELRALAERSPSDVAFTGVEPAAQMRALAAGRVKHLKNVTVVDGSFEDIPLGTASLDYLYSIYAFHWTTDAAQSVRELRRVLKPDGKMDLVFVGNTNGAEFNKVTTPVMRKYMGRAYMLTAGKMQQQITRQSAGEMFAAAFPRERLSVDESFETHYDTLDGHWAWRVRIEGHFSKIPADKRKDFDAEVREGLQGLATEKGIPYTIHQLHVKIHA